MECDIDTIVNEAQCLMCLNPYEIQLVKLQLACELLQVASNLVPQ